ncbi:MAG TPA: ATP-binding protein [Pseudolabrys sp.]|nr:ATP-binding protein [Pseudolabrys sp.]
MRLFDFLRTTTFRWTLTVAGSFILCILVLFGFVYWQTVGYLTSTIDTLLTGEIKIIAGETVERRLADIDERLRNDPRRFRITGLFDAEGRRIAGNVESVPPGLVPDAPTSVTVTRVDSRGRETQTVRLVVHPLPGGDVLVIGRNIDEVGEIGEIVGNALLLGLIPALVLSVAIGIFLSLRTQNRLSDVNRTIQRIVAGDLRERLPARGRDDPFDQLAVSVNRMLGEIEALILKVVGVGDDIAHELRTPLTRVRIILERGRANAKSLEESQQIADRAIAGLDQSLSIITALLRIAEIEHNRRLAAFSDVPLAELLRQVCDLYEPIAEDKGMTLRVEVKEDVTVRGDRDLLLEAVANLLDNAIKYTPEGGSVDLSLFRNGNESIIQVRDSGPGISEDERDAVTQRFYRSDKSRRSEGVGLGLSLVAAIVKLHGFQFTISSGPGCVAQIVCAPSAINRPA